VANLIDLITNWPLKKKISLLILVGATVASMVFMLSWAQKAPLQILYSNVNEVDSGLMIQKLKELKVPYKVEGGGIYVPSDKVYELRLQLAAQGLPQGGGIGFEIFDKTSFGTSDFVQKLNYRRALQGELSRTIQALAEIESCRVHLAVPEKNFFQEKESKTSASVMLKLKSGRTLSKNQVQGIVHLVSSSVEGLSPQEVTVIDNRGGMLTRPVQDGDAQVSNNQLELQRAYEKEVESSVIKILEPVAGKDKVKVKVSAALDFTRTEKTEEKFDPNGQVVRSEQKNQEKSMSGAAGGGGVPGTTSNLPNKKSAQTAPSGSGGASTQKQSEVINYEVSKVVNRVISPSQELKKLSVAVLVDGSYSLPQGSKAKKYSARTEEELKRFEELVKKAVGFSSERGDEVRVVNMPFETVAVEELPDSGRDYWPLLLSAARYLGPILAFMVVFLFVLKPLTKELLAPAINQTRAQSLSLPHPVPEIPKPIDNSEVKALTMSDDVRNWAKTHPDQAASLIKGWTEEA